jgi:hypothetical protein
LFHTQSVVIPNDRKPVELTAAVDTSSKYTLVARLRPTNSGGNGVYLGPESVGVNNGFLLSNDAEMDDGITMNPQVTVTLQPGETVWAAQFTGVQQIVDILAYST